MSFRASVCEESIQMLPDFLNNKSLQRNTIYCSRLLPVFQEKHWLTWINEERHRGSRIFSQTVRFYSGLAAAPFWREFCRSCALHCSTVEDYWELVLMPQNKTSWLRAQVTRKMADQELTTGGQVAQKKGGSTSGIKNFFAGGIGGMCCVATGHPLDTIKVNYCDLNFRVPRTTIVCCKW